MADEKKVQTSDIAPSGPEAPAEASKAMLAIPNEKIIDTIGRTAHGSEVPAPGDESKTPDAELKNSHRGRPPKDKARPEDKTTKLRKSRFPKAKKTVPAKSKAQRDKVSQSKTAKAAPEQSAAMDNSGPTEPPVTEQPPSLHSVYGLLLEALGAHQEVV